MFVFILAQLPLPIILYLNWRVTVKFFRVRRLAKDAPIQKPRRLHIGWWLTNLATVIALIPALFEWRIFVQDSRWLLAYGVSAALTITGLALMNSALGEELHSLARSPRRKTPAKPVDSSPPDKL